MTDAIAIGFVQKQRVQYTLAIGGAVVDIRLLSWIWYSAVGVRANAAERASAFKRVLWEFSKSVTIGYTAKASAQKATSNYEFSGSHGTPSLTGYNTETITVNSTSAPAVVP